MIVDFEIDNSHSIISNIAIKSILSENVLNSTLINGIESCTKSLFPLDSQYNIELNIFSENVLEIK